MPLSGGRTPMAAPALSIKVMRTELSHCAETCGESGRTYELNSLHLRWIESAIYEETACGHARESALAPQELRLAPPLQGCNERRIPLIWTVMPNVATACRRLSSGAYFVLLDTGTEQARLKAVVK